MNIKHAQYRKKKVSFTFEKEKVTFSFNRAALTPRFAREVRESADAAEIEGAVKLSEIEGAVQMLGRLVLDWDLVDDDKQQVPFSTEILEDLDKEFAVAMMTAIWETVIPPPAPATDSGSSF